MNTAHIFSCKADKYARYRWSYAPPAIQIILAMAGVNQVSCVADIGAGTGILTRDLAAHAGCIFAVEPNAEMRAVAARELAPFPSCHVLDGRAEATTLPDHSVDLITIAQAIHWCEPQATKREFLRILKPGGWLAMLRNYGTDAELDQALQDVYPAETDTAAQMVGRGTPYSFYYGSESYLKQKFPFASRAGWEEFIGALSTASYAPDEESPSYAEFERRARSVFDRFSTNGQIEQHNVTELCLGQMAP